MRTSTISVADVAAIVAMKNISALAEHQRAAAHNLQITQGYWRLSQDLAGLLGTDNVNWCSFATWASYTAGHFIRGDAVPVLVRTLLQQASGVSRAIDHLLGSIADAREAACARIGVLEALEAGLATIQRTIVSGNTLVFSEIGTELARFTAAMHLGQLAERSQLECYLQTLRPGPTPEGGQGMLQDSLTHFWEAIHAPDPARKSQHILLANLLVGYHEQIRVDFIIDQAIGAPVSVTLRGMLEGAISPPVLTPPRQAPAPVDLHRQTLVVSLPPPPPPRRGMVERVMDVLQCKSDGEIGALERAWNRLATAYFMQLRLPSGDIDMGADVAMAMPGRAFPPGLERIELPPLRNLLQRLDRNPDSLVGSRARDWSELADRMNYLCDFFRTRQCDATLLRHPFTEEQRRSIDAGCIPAGPLY